MERLKDTCKNMVGVLVGVSVVVAIVLAYANHVTEGPIAEKAQQTLAQGIKDVMQANDLRVVADDSIQKEFGGKTFNFVVHKAQDAKGQDLGAAVESTVGGFGGDLKVLVGFDKEGTILGYTILATSETPGLGAKANVWFQKDGKGNVIGKGPKNGDLAVSKDGGDIDAITASTITSRAFLKAINQAYAAWAGQEADGVSGASTQKY